MRGKLLKIYPTEEEGCSYALGTFLDISLNRVGFVTVALVKPFSKALGLFKKTRSESFQLFKNNLSQGPCWS